jgi:hypothetical protein
MLIFFGTLGAVGLFLFAISEKKPIPYLSISTTTITFNIDITNLLLARCRYSLLSDEAEKKIGKMIAINRLEGLEKSILDKEHPVFY